MCPYQDVQLRSTYAAHAHICISPVVTQWDDCDTRRYIPNISRKPQYLAKTNKQEHVLIINWSIIPALKGILPGYAHCCTQYTTSTNSTMTPECMLLGYAHSYVTTSWTLPPRYHLPHQIHAAKWCFTVRCTTVTFLIRLMQWCFTVRCTTMSTYSIALPKQNALFSCKVLPHEAHDKTTLVRWRYTEILAVAVAARSS